MQNGEKTKKHSALPAFVKNKYTYTQTKCESLVWLNLLLSHRDDYQNLRLHELFFEKLENGLMARP